MKTITLTSLLMLGLLFSYEAKAQSLNLIADVQLFLEPTTPHVLDTLMMNTPNMIMEFDDSEEFKFSTSVLLLDTTEVSKIHVKAGRTQGGADLFNGSFDCDNATPSSGISYSRNKKHIVLGIGNFTNLRNIYTEVSIENTNGLVTPLVLDHINQ